MEATLGIDVGTTNAKAAVVGADGRVISQASRGFHTYHLGPGLVEQDAEDWWRAAGEAARESVVEAGRQGAEIRGIGVSGQGCALTPVAARGQPLRRAIIWMDTRAEPQCEWMRTHAAEEILAANSNLVAPYNVEPKALWLRDHEPAIFEQTHCFLTTTAFITQRLCGAFVMNRSDGGILFSYDLSRGDWSDEVLRALRLPREKLPRLVACEEVVGGLQSEAAAALGLPANIPVVAGGEDTSAAAVAAGVVHPGQAYLSLGTAGVVGICLDRQLPQPRLLSFPHVVSGIDLLSGSMSSLGAAVSWFRERFGGGKDGADAVDALSAEAATSPPGAHGLVFLPYLTGELHPILDPFARGTFIGLSLATTRADLLRAIMEGGACAIRHNLEVAAEVGARAGELRAVGGPTRSAVWCQIIADVTGLRLQVMEDTAGGAPVGDALLAAAGVGLAPDLVHTAEKRASPSATYSPRPEVRARYDALYGVYVRAYQRLKEEFRSLAELPPVGESVG
jgi:xylulokinase